MRVLAEFELPDRLEHLDPQALAEEMLTAWAGLGLLIDPDAAHCDPSQRVAVVGARRVDPGRSANDPTRVLTKVGYLNPDSGVLHRPKMDLHPGPKWVPVYLYDPLGQFAQADGGAFYDTLREAFDAAAEKVTFTVHTGERVRLVREDTDDEGGTWVFRSFRSELEETLRERGLPEDTVRFLGEGFGDPPP